MKTFLLRLFAVGLMGCLFSTQYITAENIKNISDSRDLLELIKWIKPNSLKLAIQANKALDKNYDEVAALKNLDTLKIILSNGFQGLEVSDKDAIIAANKALELQRRIVLSHPKLKDLKMFAIRYKFQGDKKARSAMGPNLGTAKNNYNNQQSNKYRGYDAEIISLEDLDSSIKTSMIFKSKNSAVISDLRLHWDAKRMLFTTVTDDDRLNVFEINTDGSGFHPMIETEEKDLEFYDATYLPNGKMIAISNIGYNGVPCVHGSDPVGNSILYDPKTKNIRRITFDQDANWNPVVMNNGKVMYTRWEYTDLTHYYSRIVMHMNPDGTEQKALYGSGSLFPNSTFDMQPLPGSASAFIGIISGHHGVARSGRLIIFDPSKSRKGVDGMVQELPFKDRTIIPEVKDGLVNGVWPQFIRPIVVDDKTFLVGAKLSKNSLWGIYLVDVYDNLVCLYQEDNAGFINPLIFKEKTIPPVIPDKVNLDDKEATVFIQDIYEGEGLPGVPRGTVKSLRLHVYDYAYVDSHSNHEAMGIQSGWDIKRNIGTVPVEEDGSVLFKIPANMPISIQPLDKDGRAIQWMRSWLTAQPGEIVSCIGCHEDQNQIVIPKRVIASEKAPSRLTLPDGGIRPFTFDLEIQPILDRACISCHNGKDNPIDFRGGKKTDRGLSDKLKPTGFYRNGFPVYGTSYLALHPYIHRQGPEADMSVLKPYEYHASTSELIHMLEVGHHNVKLTKDEWNTLTRWIDYNAPDVGFFDRIKPLKGYDQYSRRIELGNKYSKASIDWKKELEDYSNYLKTKGEIKPESPKPQKKGKVKNVNVKDWPFTAESALLKQRTNTKYVKIVNITPDISIKFVRIPKGEFVMGSNSGMDNNKPAHKAKVENSFWMAEMEITNEQYKALVPEHDSRYVDQQWKDHVNPGYPANEPYQPVIRVSLNEAREYCQLLSRKTGLNICLPTELQWEWACRAGSDSDMWYGDLNDDFGSFENLADVSLEKMAVKGVNPKPMSKNDPVFESYNFIPKIENVDDGLMIMGDSKKYTPNAFGLYSMHGNVAEWTDSPYVMYGAKEQYSEKYVVRGGSFRDRPQYAASYSRRGYYPWQSVYNVGFRVVINE